MSYFEQQAWFADVMLWTVYVLLAVALCAVAWSVLRSARLRGRSGGLLRLSRGAGGSSIAWGVAALLAVTLLGGWLFGSSEPLPVMGGGVYADAFWLRTSDMLIIAALVLVLVAAVCVLFGATGLARRFGWRQPGRRQ